MTKATPDFSREAIRRIEQIELRPALLAGAFRSSVFYLSLGHAVWSEQIEKGIDYRRYLDPFPGLRFFVSRAQHDALRRLGDASRGRCQV